jgi:hypothetical protein
MEGLLKPDNSAARASGKQFSEPEAQSERM